MPSGGVLARFIGPGGGGFELLFSPGGGKFIHQKNCPGGWSGLELTHTLRIHYRVKGTVQIKYYNKVSYFLCSFLLPVPGVTGGSTQRFLPRAVHQLKLLPKTDAKSHSWRL